MSSDLLASFVTSPPLAVRAVDEAVSRDVIVIGGTPAGVVLAVRAAREGAAVLLVNHTRHLGGMLANGLGVWDTRYERKRSPIYDEVRQAIFDHYRTTYGSESPQYRDALPGEAGHSNGKFEPVAEKILTALVARESRITVVSEHFPAAVEREGASIVSVTFMNMHGPGRFRAVGRVFADCSYEADIFPLAGIPFRVGRESQGESGEADAGVVFMQPVGAPPSPAAEAATARQAGLRLRHFPGFQERRPESTGEGDLNLQAINYRIILTIDPANRISAQRPDDYDTALIRELEFGSEIDGIPNRKLGLNRPQLLGPANSYVERDWAARRRVMDDHWEAALEMLWFRQSDPAVSEEERRRWCEYGLARDEFADHGHRPYEIYFREGRRLRGRSRLTQADTTPLPGMSRPPLHTDSIAFTEWYVDSHACTPRRVNGSLEEGKIMLHQETFSGQIPFDALLPEGVDNLTVPVCLSATHVAWNTVRLESTWMHLAESAAHATVHAVRCHQNIAAIDRDGLLRTLAACGVALAFSNDLESTLGDETVAAAQYFSTRGFLPDYDARLAMPLDRGIDREWAWGWQADGIEAEPIAFARWVGLAAAYAEGAISRVEFAAMLPPAELDGRGETNFTRGEALTILWRLVKSRPSLAGASLPEEPLTSLPSSVSYI